MGFHFVHAVVAHTGLARSGRRFPRAFCRYRRGRVGNACWRAGRSTRDARSCSEASGSCTTTACVSLGSRRAGTRHCFRGRKHTGVEHSPERRAKRKPVRSGSGRSGCRRRRRCRIAPRRRRNLAVVLAHHERGRGARVPARYVVGAVLCLGAGVVAGSNEQVPAPLHIAPGRKSQPWGLLPVIVRGDGVGGATGSRLSWGGGDRGGSCGGARGSRWADGDKAARLAADAGSLIEIEFELGHAWFGVRTPARPTPRVRAPASFLLRALATHATAPRETLRSRRVSLGWWWRDCGWHEASPSPPTALERLRKTRRTVRGNRTGRRQLWEQATTLNRRVQQIGAERAVAQARGFATRTSGSFCRHVVCFFGTKKVKQAWGIYTLKTLRMWNYVSNSGARVYAQVEVSTTYDDRDVVADRGRLCGARGGAYGGGVFVYLGSPTKCSCRWTPHRLCRCTPRGRPGVATLMTYVQL